MTETDKTEDPVDNVEPTTIYRKVLVDEKLPDEIEKLIADGLDKYHELVRDCAVIHLEEKAPVMLVLYVILDKEKIVMRNRIRTLTGGYSEENVIRAIEKTPGFVQIARYSMFIDHKIWTNGFAIREIIDTGDGMFDMNHIPTPNLTSDESHKIARGYYDKASELSKLPDALSQKEAKRLFRQVYYFEKFAAEKSVRPRENLSLYGMAAASAGLAGMSEELEAMKQKAIAIQKELKTDGI